MDGQEFYILLNDQTGLAAENSKWHLTISFLFSSRIVSLFTFAPYPVCLLAFFCLTRRSEEADVGRIRKTSARPVRLINWPPCITKVKVFWLLFYFFLDDDDVFYLAREAVSYFIISLPTEMQLSVQPIRFVRRGLVTVKSTLSYTLFRCVTLSYICIEIGCAMRSDIIGVVL